MICLETAQGLDILKNDSQSWPKEIMDICFIVAILWAIHFVVP